MTYDTEPYLEIEENEVELDYSTGEDDVVDGRRRPLNKDLFSNYLREIGRYPLLTRKEEIDLGAQVQAMMEYEEPRRKLGISLKEFIKIRKLKTREVKRIYAKGEKAKEKLITHNLRLVVSVARRYSTINLSIYDMVQEGNLGLIRGAEKYNPLKYNVKFSTYVSWWIKESINKGITNGGRTIRLPVHVTDKIRVLRKAKKEFYIMHSRMPTVTELMEVSGLSRDIITRVSPHLNKPLSLDLKLEPELTLMDYIADPTILEDNPELIKDHLQSTVADILSCLTYQEQRILVAMYGLLGSPKMDLVEVASVEKLTVQQVGTLKTGAIKKLQAEFGELPEVKRYILSAIAYD